VINGEVVSKWFPASPVWQRPGKSLEMFCPVCVVTMSNEKQSFD
jgi:hypothetical protein